MNDFLFWGPIFRFFTLSDFRVLYPQQRIKLPLRPVSRVLPGGTHIPNWGRGASHLRLAPSDPDLAAGARKGGRPPARRVGMQLGEVGPLSLQGAVPVEEESSSHLQCFSHAGGRTVHCLLGRAEAPAGGGAGSWGSRGFAVRRLQYREL